MNTVRIPVQRKALLHAEPPFLPHHSMQVTGKFFLTEFVDIISLFLLHDLVELCIIRFVLVYDKLIIIYSPS